MTQCAFPPNRILDAQRNKPDCSGQSARLSAGNTAIQIAAMMSVPTPGGSGSRHTPEQCGYNSRLKCSKFTGSADKQHVTAETRLRMATGAASWMSKPPNR
jgi:hypothetical protein